MCRKAKGMCERVKSSDLLGLKNQDNASAKKKKNKRSRKIIMLLRKMEVNVKRIS